MISSSFPESLDSEIAPNQIIACWRDAADELTEAASNELGCLTGMTI
jgi:hypothetical protein